MTATHSIQGNKTRLEIVQRTPKRLSVTIPYALHQRLIERSDMEGRSISNLAAFLLEFGLGR